MLTALWSISNAWIVSVKLLSEVGSMDFDNPKVYGDTSFTDDGLVIKEVLTTWEFQKY